MSITLRSLSVVGISSMIRDLGSLSPSPERLEKAIQDGQAPLNPALFHELPILSKDGRQLRIGDVLLFRLRPDARSAYPNIETLWGKRVRLDHSGVYIGVLCERSSSKLITATFQQPPVLVPELDLQLVAQGGGIGFATGHSRSLLGENGHGAAPDLEILGAVVDHASPDKVLNIDNVRRLALPSAEATFVPTILCVGTATDVGKTTLMCALIQSLAKRASIVAVKASGTGWYEDSLMHMEAGAIIGLNFTLMGLPTTYKLSAAIYRERTEGLMRLAAQPDHLPIALRPAHLRNTRIPAPDIRLVEHGGDILEAGIPEFFTSQDLMQSVKAVVICCESALSLMGAVSMIKRWFGNDQVLPELYASMPLVNPEGFFVRIEPLLKEGIISGIVDVNKPTINNVRNRRLSYSLHYDQIMFIEDLAARIMSHILRSPPDAHY